MKTIQERILQYLDLKNITPYRFCKDLGFSMGYLDKKGAIGTDKYLKIIEYYKDINPEWLLKEKGEILKKENEGIDNSKEKLDLITEVFRLSAENSQLKETNDLLRFKLGALEEKLSESNYTRPDSTVYRSVAEPQSELIKKPKKDDAKN